MTTKAKALDRLIDAIAGEDVPMNSQTVAGRLDTLADTLAGDDVSFTAQDIAGRIDELAGMIEDGTIVVGGGFSFKPFNDGHTHFLVEAYGPNDEINMQCGKSGDGELSIDWGDGTITAMTSSTSAARHKYTDFAGLHNITVISDGSAKLAVRQLAQYDSMKNYRYVAVEFSSDVIIYSNCLASEYLLADCIFDDSIESIPDSAFKSCYDLANCNLPASCGSIATSAFQSCYKHVLSDKDLTVLSKVATIGDSAFYGAAALAHAIDLSGVNTIGQSAFYSCALLESVVIGEHVTSIGNNAFASIPALREVTVKATTPPTITDYTFNNDSTLGAIYVPAASVDAYKAASGWSTHAGKIQAIPA